MIERIEREQRSGEGGVESERKRVREREREREKQRETTHQLHVVQSSPSRPLSKETISILLKVFRCGQTY